MGSEPCMLGRFAVQMTGARPGRTQGDQKLALTLPLGYFLQDIARCGQGDIAKLYAGAIPAFGRMQHKPPVSLYRSAEKHRVVLYWAYFKQIGSASCRERVCQYV